MKTKMNTNELVDAIMSFVKISGAGIVAFMLLFLANLPVSAEQIFLLAVLVAVDRYCKDKGYYTKIRTNIGFKK